jgi:type IV pilus assembly protein PilM
MARTSVIAIDIGANTVKLVQFALSSSETRLVRAGIASYPRLSATGDIEAETVSQNLEQLWHDVKGGKHTVLLSIPRLLVTTRRLSDFPAAVTDEQLSNLVSIQAETEIPFSAESAIFDYHNIRRGENGVSVDLIAAKRESVQKYINYLKPIGVVPMQIIPSAMATATLARPLLGADAPERTTIIADIGAGSTDVCLFQEQKLRFSRSFPIGGNGLTLSYQDEVGGDFEFAERIKLGRAGLDQESTDRIPTYRWAEQLATQIEQSIGAARRELEPASSGEVDELWLCGGGAQIAGLADYLAKRLGIATKLWNPLDAYREQGGRIDMAPVGDVGNTLAVALGMGMNAATSEITLDLLPREEKAKLTQSEQRRRLIYSFAAGVVLFAGLGLGGLTLSRTQRMESTVLDEEIRRIAQSESRARQTLAKNLAIADLLTPRVSALDILRELSLRFSDRTRVAWTNFHISRLDELNAAKITFNIEARSHGDVSEMIRVMGQSGLFTNIKSGDVTSVKREKEMFFHTQIVCNLSSDAPQILAQSRFPSKGSGIQDQEEEKPVQSGKNSTTERSQLPHADPGLLAESPDEPIVDSNR